jgi:hypothetical protein
MARDSQPRRSGRSTHDVAKTSNAKTPDGEGHMAHLAVKISSHLEAAARDVSIERKTSLDNLVGVALTEYLQSSPRRVYQISTSSALVEGVYSGSVSSSTLLEHGDFGVGTFEGLDGEMVILDGEIYQVAGNVRQRSDEFLVPFASVTHFCEDAAFQIDELLPFSSWSMAILIAIGAVILVLINRSGNVMTTSITTAVVMVVAGISPQHAWRQPILWLFDTLIGIAVGITAVWIGRGLHAALSHFGESTLRTEQSQ